MTSRYSSWRAQSVTESGRTLARIDTWTVYSPKIVTALPDAPVVHFCLSQRTQFYRFDSKWPNEEVDICLGESYMHPDIKQKKKSTQGRGVKSSLATEDAGLIGRRRKTVEKKKNCVSGFLKTMWHVLNFSLSRNYTSPGSTKVQQSLTSGCLSPAWWPSVKERQIGEPLNKDVLKEKTNWWNSPSLFSQANSEDKHTRTNTPMCTHTHLSKHGLAVRTVLRHSVTDGSFISRPRQ